MRYVIIFTLLIFGCVTAEPVVEPCICPSMDAVVPLVDPDTGEISSTVLITKGLLNDAYTNINFMSKEAYDEFITELQRQINIQESKYWEDVGEGKR